MAVSVIIRTRDEAPSIGRLLDLLADQSVRAEIVVVDSGSTDGTVDIVAARGVRLLVIPGTEFTFGRSLNRGVAATSGDIVVALSAHAFPRSTAWLADVCRWFEDPAVGCVFGETVDPTFAELRAPVRQDSDLASLWPFWGYSNGAGAFRRALWEADPFDESLTGSEDREWVLRTGAVCVLDPALAVEHDHASDDLRTSFRRYAREARGYAAFGVRSDGSIVREWWRDQGGHRTQWRARLDPKRAVRLAGRWWGARPR